MNDELKPGDVCVVRLLNPGCPVCSAINGRECTVKDAAVTAIRLSCSGMPQLSRFYRCEVDGRLEPAFLHRTELVKKRPPADASQWIRQETVPRQQFDAWLQHVRECRPAELEQ